MASVQQLECVSVSDYLEGEKHAGARHEFVGGIVHAMAGASTLHNLVTLALASTLRTHLRGSPCRVFQSDMKVRVGDDFYYPDVLVTCESGDPDAYYQSDPVLIAEVLSESTETRDRLEKRLAYQSLKSLEECALVNPRKILVEIFRRTETAWELQTFEANERVALRSVEFEFPVEMIYEDAMGYAGP